MIPDDELDQALSDQDGFQTLQNNSLKLARKIILLNYDAFNQDKLDELKELAQVIIPKKFFREEW